MTARRAGLGVAIPLLAAISCGAPRPDAGSERYWTMRRLIEPAPRDAFRASEVADAQVAFDWSFLGDPRGWPRIVGTVDESWRGSGVRLAKVDGQMVLEGDVQVDASAIDLIEVATTRKSLWASVVYWTPPGGALSRECSVRLSGAEAATSTLVFPLAGHPCWQGPIGHLRFVVGSPGDTLRILTVRGLHRRYSAARARELAGSQWRLDLDGEVRDARIASLGEPWRVPIECPEGTRLELSYTAGVLPERAFEFAISFAAGGSAPTPLFRDRWDPEPGAATTSWREATVDLAACHGSAGTLIFEVSGATLGESQRSLPAWGDLRLVAKRTSTRPDIVLISLDTLRGDRVSISGYPRRTTPNLDAWAGRSATYFSRAVAPAPWTLPSHVSLFSGLDVISHGVDSDEGIPADLEVLAEQMRALGYRTVAVTGGGYLHPRYGMDRGFDDYVYWNRGQGSEAELAHNLEVLLDRLRDLDDQATFVFFHTYEIHSPYHSRQPYFDAFGGGEIPVEERNVVTRRAPLSAEEGFLVRTVLASPEGREVAEEDRAAAVKVLYDSSIAYTDQELGPLLEHLDRRALSRPSLSIVTSDHGEALGERGLAAHAYPYEFNLDVPLFVAFPGGREAGGIRGDLAGLVDVAPTILAAVGASAEGLDGIDLASERRGPNARLWSYAGSTNWGVALRADSDLKLILNDTAWLPNRGHRELYDLRRDPKEATNLGAQSAEADRMERVVRKRLAEELGGLVWVLRNPGPEPLVGRLVSPILHAQRLKLLESAGEVRMIWEGQGSVRFELAARASARLVALARYVEAVDLEMEQDGRHLARRFEVGEVRSGAALEWVGSGWRPALQGGGRAALEIGWSGRADEARASQPVDQKLEEQMRELGYI